VETNRRGGSVMIGVGDAKVMVERLAERRVFVDWRPSAGLRVSPHFFNTDEEVEEALNTLAELME
jgi:kynureninase